MNRLSGNMAQLEAFILQIKFSSLNLPGQCDIKIGQVHVVSIKDESTIVDPVAFFLSGRPVQLSTHECFAEESYHSHFTIVYHVKAITDTVVGSVSLEDRYDGVLQEVEFLVVRDCWFTKLESDGALQCSLPVL